MNEQTEEIVTHGATCEWRGKDGIRRTLAIRRSQAGAYQIEFATWWNGEDSDPTSTVITLKAESFDTLVAMCV